MTVIPAHIPYVVREPDGLAWLVIHRSYGWLFVSRSEALRALRNLAKEYA